MEKTVYFDDMSMKIHSLFSNTIILQIRHSIFYTTNLDYDFIKKMYGV